MVNKLVPEIRFSGFTDAWEKRKLGDVIDGLYNGQTPSRHRDDFWNGDINWLTSGELNRSIVKKVSEKITVAGQASANLRIVPKNTFVMAITGLEAAGTRGNCGILGIETTLNQSCMAIFPNKNLLSTHFLFQWYKLIGENYGIRFTQGTKQQSYNAEIIKDLEICLPKVEEQLKISKLLSNLDNLINHSQQELTAFKQTKQGFLQKMFPKEGESLPEVRFAGFTGDWEHRKLGDVGRVAMCKRIFKEQTSINGEIPFFKIGTFGGIPDSFISREVFDEYRTKYTFPERGDILISASGTIGRTVVYNGEDAYFQDSNIVWLERDKEQLDNTFLQQFYQIVKWAGVEGSIIKRLYNNNILSTEIFLPSIEEQIKIGNFFKQLDETIDLHQQELDALLETKKAFLQKMFV